MWKLWVTYGDSIVSPSWVKSSNIMISVGSILWRSLCFTERWEVVGQETTLLSTSPAFWATSRSRTSPKVQQRMFFRRQQLQLAKANNDRQPSSLFGMQPPPSIRAVPQFIGGCNLPSLQDLHDSGARKRLWPPTSDGNFLKRLSSGEMLRSIRLLASSTSLRSPHRFTLFPHAPLVCLQLVQILCMWKPSFLYQHF